MNNRYPHIKGMMPILPTFVDKDGEPDLPAQGRVVEYLLASGAKAIGHMAGASEYVKVSEYDRDAYLYGLAEQVNGRVPIFVGTTDGTHKTSLKRAEAAKAQGASMIMVCSPATGALTHDDLVKYYTEVGQVTDLPIIVQDTGPSGGQYTAETIEEIADRVPTVGYVKSEGSNWVPKCKKLVEFFGDSGVQVIGGAAGYFMPTLLRLGITAFMTGTEATDVHNDVIQAYFAGDAEKADLLYYTTILSYLNVYNQNNRYFLKYMLKRRGLLDEVYLPFPNENGVPDPFVLAEMDRTLDHINKLRGKNVM